MEFLKPKAMPGAAKPKQQLLTVGDAAGNLHVYDVPQNLWRPLTNERALMSNFLERETKRVEHSTERFEFRTAEADAMEAEELQNALNQPPEGASGGGLSGGGGEPAAGGGGGGGAETAAAAAAAEGAAVAPAKGGKRRSTVDPALQQMTEAEKAHLAEMEEKFIEELGLTDADLPERFLASKKLAEGEGLALKA